MSRCPGFFLYPLEQRAEAGELTSGTELCSKKKIMKECMRCWHDLGPSSAGAV